MMEKQDMKDYLTNMETQYNNYMRLQQTDNRSKDDDLKLDQL